MTSEDDLDAEFALFEQKIASVTAPKPTSSPHEPRKPTNNSPIPSLTPAKRPRPQSNPIETCTSTTSSASLPSSTVSKKPLPVAPAHPSPTTTTTNNPSVTGRWKWTGMKWEWITTGLQHSISPNTLLSSTTVQASQQAIHPTDSAAASSPVVQAGHSKPVKRAAAGEVWEDPTLVEWPENDHRIFVGDLAPDATDDDLEKGFAKYLSFNMAKVVRDRKSGLCKGYGFVSFADGRDMVTALREMNGKYVGSRPVKLKKSNWKKRNLDKERRTEFNLMRQIVKK